MKPQVYALKSSLRSRFDATIKQVLEDVKPTNVELESVKRSINMIMGRLKDVTPRNVEILLAGSVSRGTQIRGNSDIDIFLLFPRSLKEAEIKKKGLEIAKNVVNKKKNESYMIK
jgi:tRNA nucleotidyltransferase (CCA-adding enzyme)